MIIRPETPRDATAIGVVTAIAFADAPHGSRTEAAIVDSLRRDGALSLSIVAEDKGHIVGHVAFSPVTIDGREGGWFGLGPVSVRPERQGEGIGGALVRAGLDALRKEGAFGCVVLGDPAYYGRFGFAADPALRYAGGPTTCFQALPFTDERAAGEVAYHEAFSAHG